MRLVYFVAVHHRYHAPARHHVATTETDGEMYGTRHGLETCNNACRWLNRGTLSSNTVTRL
jgi:hypothetical protein